MLNNRRDPHTGDSRGFGFINYTTVAEADAALALDGYEFMEKTLIVQKVRVSNHRLSVLGLVHLLLANTVVLLRSVDVRLVFNIQLILIAEVLAATILTTEEITTDDHHTTAMINVAMIVDQEETTIEEITTDTIADTTDHLHVATKTEKWTEATIADHHLLETTLTDVHHLMKGKEDFDLNIRH